MPANDREVYQHFHVHGGASPEVIALAYAGYAKAKYDWVAHIEARRGTPPLPEEVDRWITDLPDSRLEDLRQDAIDFFDLAARAYMAAEIESAVETARDAAVIREVRASNQALVAQMRKATAFGSTFLSNLFVGIVASFAFSFLIIAASLIFTRDPSPFALYRSLQPNRPPKSSSRTLPLPGNESGLTAADRGYDWARRCGKTFPPPYTIILPRTSSSPSASALPASTTLPRSMTRMPWASSHAKA